MPASSKILVLSVEISAALPWLPLASTHILNDIFVYLKSNYTNKERIKQFILSAREVYDIIAL